MQLVFDFGAVLFSWRPADILAEVFPEQAPNPQAATQLAHAVFGHADWHDFDQGLLTEGEVAERISTRLGLPRAITADLVASIGQRLHPIAPMVQLLQTLKQRRDAQQGVQGIYYLSNMPLPYARYLEQAHDFLRWFDGGIFSADVQRIKPDPAIYQALEQRYCLQPPCIVFVDDLKPNVLAAQQQGWRAIHFQSAGQLVQELGPLLGT